MKIEQDTTIAQSVTTSGRKIPTETFNNDWMSSKPIKNIIKKLPNHTQCYVSRAPGRLNVMGGLAEYTGSLVLNMPANDLIYVAVQPRTQKEIALIIDNDDPLIVPLSQLDEYPTQPQSDPQDNKIRLTRCVFGMLAELRRTKLIPDFFDGVTIVVARNHPEVCGAAEHISAASAVMVAVSAMGNAKLDPLQAAGICQKIENNELNIPVGISDVLCTLQGYPNTIFGMRCDPYTHDGSVQLTDGVRVVGIDCGTIHSDAEIKYRRVRTASFMGRTLIDRIIQHDGKKNMQWDGYLSRVSVTDFVECFRDRIPTKMKGSEFLDRFGDTDDPLTSIEPNINYKIRSRTEHHIYEHTRCQHLMECLSRNIRSGDAQTLVDAQSQMFASHWSYGQRCGLGSIETDLLVNLIRQHGTNSDLYGAKISGHGCGGMVTVLMKPTNQALAALDRVMNDYAEQTNIQPTLMSESTPGAMVSGAQQILL